MSRLDYRRKALLARIHKTIDTFYLRQQIDWDYDIRRILDRILELGITTGLGPDWTLSGTDKRAYVKLVAGLEREQQKEETPEQAIERKRRADGEVREMIEGHVLEYEARAKRDGVCLHCRQPLPEESR